MSAFGRRTAALFVCTVPVICFGATQPPNVVLITVDTLRANHLSCYRNAWKTLPNIDQLAA